MEKAKFNLTEFRRKLDFWMNTYVSTFITIFAVVGFLFGSFALGLWFVENTGEFPSFIRFWLRAFDFGIYLGLGLIIFKAYLWLIDKIFLPAAEKSKQRREAKTLFYQERMAKLIAQEIKKSNKKRK